MEDKYTFGEEQTDRKTGYKTWKSPQYERQKEIAVGLLRSDSYKNVISESDFWIRKRTVSDKNGCYVEYSGLSLSHNAFLKINETLPEGNRFDQRYVGEPVEYEFPSKDGNGISRGFYMSYRDERDGMLEVGEISDENLDSSYPFAILFKRVFDRVVKRKAGIIGIYSDSEDIVYDDMDSVKPQSITDSLICDSLKEKEIKTMKNADNKAKTGKTDVKDALEHEIRDSKNWKGHKVREILEYEKFSEENKKKILAKLSVNSSSEEDRENCLAVLKALENGEKII